MKKAIATDKAPAAVGPYSQAIEAGDFIFCSGQVPIDPAAGKIVATDAASQGRQALENIKAILESKGLDMSSIVKATVFAMDMNDFKAVNEVYATYFVSEPPARSFVQISQLPLGALVEVEVIAYKG